MSTQQVLRKRIFAFIFDFGTILTSWVAINLSFARFISSFNDHVNVFPNFKFADNFTLFSILLVYPICFVGYFTASYYISNGSSLGKSLMGIKFKNRHRITLQSAFVRANLQFVSYLCFSLPNLISFLSSDNSSLIDKALGTTHFNISNVSELKLDNLVRIPVKIENEDEDSSREAA